MSKRTTTTFRVVVTVDDESLKQIKQVASALKSAGMKVDQVMSTLGVISGTVDKSKVSALKKVKGVAVVEPDEEMKAI
jgi:thiamine biosynthesis lipoprotein ApbE